MKILHTADLHLDEESEERWEALDEILRVADEQEVDLVSISGDLFDHDTDAEKLRNRLRDALSGGDFPVAIIPGNHDAESFRRGLHFGEQVEVLDNPDQPLQCGDLNVWGLPFSRMNGEEVLGQLRALGERMEETDGRHVLLFHGELLDAFYSQRDFGDEEGSYMPAKLSYFRDLPVDCVLAGHFHSRFADWELDNETDGFFVYPGSPVSVTRRETGVRKVNILEPGGGPRGVELETRYYEDIRVVLDPVEGTDPVERVREELEDLPKHAAPLLTVTGYLNAEKLGTTEKEVIEELQGMAEGVCEHTDYSFMDVSRIVEDDLFQRFMSKVDSRGYEEDEREEMRDLVMRAMMEATI